MVEQWYCYYWLMYSEEESLSKLLFLTLESLPFLTMNMLMKSP